MSESRRSGLLVVDVQNDVVAQAFHRDQVVATIAGLVDRARAEQVPVIWVQHSSVHLERGSAAWEIVPELVPSAEEAIVHKTWGTPSRRPTWPRCWALPGSDAWWSPAPSRMPASGPPCTVR